MARGRNLLIVLIGLAFLLPYQAAEAGASTTTRNRCRWWSKKYVANAHTGCLPFGPLCYRHSGSCGDARATCGFTSCPFYGGAYASAVNGPGGASTFKYRYGLGFAGTPPVDATAGDSGDSAVESVVEFDDNSRTVKVSIPAGHLTDQVGGLGERLSVFIFKEDVREGVEVEEPVRTPENTLWQASAVLHEGALSLDGFDPGAFSFGTGGTDTGCGLSTTVTISNAHLSVPLFIAPTDFENLVVEVLLDEYGRPSPPPSRKGMTWAKTDHNFTFGTDKFNCSGCDAYVGDTLCSESRPILCIRPDGSPNPGLPVNFYDGWIGGNVGLSPAIRGDQLLSLANANAVCANSFGPGWEMSEFHHPLGGWGWSSYGNVSASNDIRFWVYINDQAANCWN